MKYTDALASFKARLDAGEDVFAPLIQNYLLDNPHRVTLELQPDVGLGEKQETEEKDTLKAYRCVRFWFAPTVFSRDRCFLFLCVARHFEAFSPCQARRSVDSTKGQKGFEMLKPTGVRQYD